MQKIKVGQHQNLQYKGGASFLKRKPYWKLQDTLYLQKYSV